MKHEWRKHEKNIYLPKVKPVIVEIPSFKYITIEGTGNPNSELFSKCIEVLYALSYGVKMGLKNDPNIKDYYEYTVYPLEGVWNFNEEGIKKYKEGASVEKLKDFFEFTLMIRQPDFLTDELFSELQDTVYNKKKLELVKMAKFEDYEEGLCAQMLHNGPYDTEPESFDKMEEFIKKEGYERVSKVHREIYISDARRVSPEKLKTTLRVQIKKQ